MSISDELWNSYAAATRDLREQQKRVFEILQKMADAILEEKITDSDEIDEILLEIYVFIDCYGPALDLYKEMCRHIREKNPVFWRVESPLIRAIFEGKDGLDSAGNMSRYDPASFISGEALYAELGITQEAIDKLPSFDDPPA